MMSLVKKFCMVAAVTGDLTSVDAVDAKAVSKAGYDPSKDPGMMKFIRGELELNHWHRILMSLSFNFNEYIPRIARKLLEVENMFETTSTTSLTEKLDFGTTKIMDTFKNIGAFNPVTVHKFLKELKEQCSKITVCYNITPGLEKNILNEVRTFVTNDTVNSVDLKDEKAVERVLSSNTIIRSLKPDSDIPYVLSDTAELVLKKFILNDFLQSFKIVSYQKSVKHWLRCELISEIESIKNGPISAVTKMVKEVINSAGGKLNVSFEKSLIEDSKTVVEMPRVLREALNNMNGKTTNHGKGTSSVAGTAESQNLSASASSTNGEPMMNAEGKSVRCGVSSISIASIILFMLIVFLL